MQVHDEEPTALAAADAPHAAADAPLGPEALQAVDGPGVAEALQVAVGPGVAEPPQAVDGPQTAADAPQPGATPGVARPADPGHHAPDSAHDAHRPLPADRQPPPHAGAARDPERRARDHREIDRLADALLPDLVDRLAASGLGEIEVREDQWRIRLRLPAAAPRARRATSDGRDGRGTDGVRDRHDRSADRPMRAPAIEGTPTAQRSTGQTAAEARNGTSGGTTPAGSGGVGTSAVPHRVVALSPAVGVFQPRAEIRPGARVRQGDRLGAVDLLGVPQDVVAPDDGVVVDLLAQRGEGVEYGQDLVVIEPARGRAGADSNGAVEAAVTEA